MNDAETSQTPEPVPPALGTKIAEVRPSKRAVYLAIVLLTVFAILGCAMDVVMVVRLRGFGGDLLIMDLASEPGFDVYAPQRTTQVIDGELRHE